MAKTEIKPISLALQGGGAHGAYTWGVLDLLLERGMLDVQAITATSAGAMNAVAYAAGLARGGPDGARETLEQFWRAVARAGAPFAALNWWNGSPLKALTAFQGVTSPYDTNPFNLNPLRRALEQTIDFDAARAADVDLFLSATNVETGRVKVFDGDEITIDAVLASACLPNTFKAVEIDGNNYWDGGYLGNPSLFPLIYGDAPRDVLLVLLNPISRAGVPRTPGDISERINEISFNAALIGELRAIAFVQRLLDDGMLKQSIMKQYKRLNVHAIRGGQDLIDLDLHTKYDTRWSFLVRLRDMGRAAGANWLDTCARDVGTGESSVDLREEFLED